MAAPRTKQRIGNYQKGNDWTGYWKTSVSDVHAHELSIRGYPIGQVVSNLSYTEALFLTVRGEVPTPSQRRVFDAALTSMPDHFFLSSQAGAARFVASAWPSSPVPAIAAGLLCMGEITISPQVSAELILEGLNLVRSDALSFAEAAHQLVEKHLSQGKFVPGFGHPQHKDVDIRTAALRRVVEEEGLALDGHRFYDEVHKVLIERKGQFLPMNIDGALACAYTDLGFTPLEMPGLAGIGIMPGIIGQVVEEITEGVPLRVIHDGTYTGHAPRQLETGLYVRERKKT
jgi:citryl-CoA lyase